MNTQALIDDTITQLPVNQSHSGVADERIGQWRGAVEQELQALITQAAQVREQSNAAKTSTKRVYFQKKFKKISAEVMQMVAAMQRIDAHKAALKEAKQEASDHAALHTA